MKACTCALLWYVKWCKKNGICKKKFTGAVYFHESNTNKKDHFAYFKKVTGMGLYLRRY